MLGLFSDCDFLLSRIRVHGAQFDAFLASFTMFVVKAFAVRKPVESWSALELHFKGISFYIDAFAFANVENDWLRLRKRFSRQRVDNAKRSGAKLAGRNKLQVCESARIARVHAVGDEL